MEFSAEYLNRYDRQIRLLGLEGQNRLGEASVLIVGVGGLGSPVALYLAGAGVGKITLCDPDRVDLSNLHRQILYVSADERLPKSSVAQKRIQEVNSAIEVKAYSVAFDETTAERLTEGQDLLIDASDNFATRSLLNDWSLRRKIPLVQASLLKFEGQISIFDGLGGPCYRCLFPELPPAPNCAEAGVLGPLVGIFGSYQALEALKILSNVEAYPFGTLLRLDSRKNRWSTVKITADPQCSSCGGKRREKEKKQMGRDTNEVQISARELSELLKTNGTELLDVREPDERAIASLGGHFIPLGDLTQRYQELDPLKPLVVYCHHGVRSLHALGYLKQMGFENVKNLKGGIDAWSREVDPNIARY